MAVILVFLALAFAETVSGKRLCDNEHVHLDFSPEESFIASFSDGSGVTTVFVSDRGNNIIKVIILNDHPTKNSTLFFCLTVLKYWYCNYSIQSQCIVICKDLLNL